MLPSKKDAFTLFEHFIILCNIIDITDTLYDLWIYDKMQKNVMHQIYTQSQFF